MLKFYALQVFLDQIHYAEEPDKLFWGKLEGKTYAIVEKCLEHWKVVTFWVLFANRLYLIQPVRELNFWGFDSSVFAVT